MTCRATADGLPQKYVRGTLEGRELEEFERHLLECEACRSGVRAIAASGAAGRTRLRRSRLVTIASLAAAAGLVAIVMRPRSELERLARVDPPAFRGATIRAGDTTTAAVDRGMAAYTRGEYALAARELRRSSDSSAGVSLYLGAALLAAGQSADAIVVLRRAVEAPFSPYADDARVVLAKAWLRAGVIDSALASLRGIRDGTPIAPHARALADSIERLGR